jgi:hypothetical protein
MARNDLLVPVHSNLSESEAYKPLKKPTNALPAGWIKNLKQQFEKLADEQGVSKTSLLNEAIADLLRKYMQK